MYAQQQLASLIERIEALAATEDNTGCGEDLTVVGAAEFKAVIDEIARLRANPCRLVLGEHQHRHGSSFYTFLVPAGGKFDASDLAGHLQETYEPDLEKALTVQETSPILVEACEPDREAIADRIFEVYDFGDGAQVLDHGRWDTSDPLDYTKIAYVEYDDDPPEADSHKVSFHVRFDAAGKVTDAYALECDKGQDIGRRGDIDKVAPGEFSKLITKDGEEVAGTYETMPGTSGIDLATRQPDGTLDLEYAGGTDVCWDDQKTVKVNGERQFVTASGKIVPESEVILVPA